MSFYTLHWVHVIRNPVEMVERVFRCMRMTATLVSVLRSLKANIVRKYNGRHFGGMTLTQLGPTGETTCSSTTLVTAIQRNLLFWTPSLVSGGRLYWDACSWLGKHHYKWRFNSSNDVAHAVWRAFHDHQLTYYQDVLNRQEWAPDVLSGNSPGRAQDSFMYREQNGIRSILLDDDNCYCYSSLSFGHGMCFNNDNVN